jgi:hypothetical protein
VDPAGPAPTINASYRDCSFPFPDCDCSDGGSGYTSSSRTVRAFLSMTTRELRRDRTAVAPKRDSGNNNPAILFMSCTGFFIMSMNPLFGIYSS